MRALLMAVCLASCQASESEMSLKVRSRRILVHGISVEQVDALLGELGALGPPGAPVPIGVAGPVDGWIAIDPGAGLHAFHVHNMTLWLTSAAVVPDRVILLSDGDTPASSYWLVPDPDGMIRDDALVGYQSDGTALIVRVPDATVWRGVKHAQPMMPRATFLLTRGVPSGLDSADLHGIAGYHDLRLPLEEVGDALNPGLEATSRPRKGWGWF